MIVIIIYAQNITAFEVCIKKTQIPQNAIHLGFLKGRFRAAHYSGDYRDEGIIPTSYRHDLTKYT